MFSVDSPLEADTPIWSVSDFSQYLQKNLQDVIPLCWVIGEISGVYKAQSGHVYATLKDQQAQMKVVIYASVAQRLAFKLEEGLKVRFLGQATLYRPRGELQLVAKSVEPDGLGPLKLAFEQIKAKLQQEGLFSPAHKKKLPAYPQSIALITSADGAVYHDMMRVLMRRYPIARVRLFSCSVQGHKAIPEILKALSDCASQAQDDVVIIARGGGSLEDLWAFNTEEVVRAVFDFPLPIISAIGHETDVTLCDFVADLRAATPSVAAELAVPSLEALYDQLKQYEQNWSEKWRNTYRHYQQRLDYQERFLKQSSFLFEQLKGQVDQAEKKLLSSMNHCLSKQQLLVEYAAKSFMHFERKIDNHIVLIHQKLKSLFDKMSISLQHQHSQQIEKLSYFSFRLNQLNPENPGHLSLYSMDKVKLKSAVGLKSGMQAQLQFHDGSWIVEFLKQIS